ncbi:MAG: chorismate synthase [bacterium]|nr:chorismate synthase [bacterium]
MTWGESHGPGVGCVIDGMPAGMPLNEDDINAELARRRPGQSSFTSPRSEPDTAEILSGVFHGLTLGTPVMIMVRNKNARSADYEELAGIFRPSHGDFTWQEKFGHRDYRGGGRASARETVGRVAAGACAGKLVKLLCGAEVIAWVSALGTIEAAGINAETVTREDIEASPMRCPDIEASRLMTEAAQAAREAGDSLGGIITLAVRNIPSGLGEPVFDKLEARLAQALLSIPAAKGFENGSGFSGAKTFGSENNDPFIAEDGKIKLATNNSGGIQAGISTGSAIICRIAFKPIPTICKEQHTVRADGTPCTFTAGGRHDACALPRAVPVCEAMANLALADFLLLQRSRADIF